MVARVWKDLLDQQLLKVGQPGKRNLALEEATTSQLETDRDGRKMTSWIDAYRPRPSTTTLLKRYKEVSAHFSFPLLPDHNVTPTVDSDRNNHS